MFECKKNILFFWKYIKDYLDQVFVNIGIRINHKEVEEEENQAIQTV